MKKFLLTLALTVMCAFGLTACGETEQAELPISNTDAEQVAESTISIINQVVLAEQVDDYVDQFTSYYGEDAGDAFASACDIFSSGLDEIGFYKSIVADSVEVTGDADDYTISFEIVGSDRNANVEMYYDADTIVPDMMISPQYTLGEKMAKAGMNTLLGMGTVFAVLILIMFLIQLFAFIPKIEKSIADKKAKKNVKTETAVDNTIAQIIEKEELSDDTELVAVIAAAIAASEGAASTDGFVVRSIKRANKNKWQRA